MIRTGSYENIKTGNCISISGDGGKGAGFEGKVYKRLAPKLGFWQEWHNNSELITEEAQVNQLQASASSLHGSASANARVTSACLPLSERQNNNFYIREYYNQVLKNLDAREVLEDIEDMGNPTLLCYESPDEFCHRHIVSAWFELELNISTAEVDAKGNHLKRPNYIKSELSKVMQQKSMQIEERALR